MSEITINDDLKLSFNIFLLSEGELQDINATMNRFFRDIKYFSLDTRRKRNGRGYS